MYVGKRNTWFTEKGERILNDNIVCINVIKCFELFIKIIAETIKADIKFSLGFLALILYHTRYSEQILT